MASKERVKVISILHFNPIELYPPVINTIRLLAKEDKKCRVNVYTTRNTKGLAEAAFQEKNIKVFCRGRSGIHLPFMTRLLTYVQFNLLVFIELFLLRRRTILYYETISSLPAVLLKGIFGKKVKLFIHYHEYMSPVEYQQGMLLVRMFHKFERRVYRKAEWISHTNDRRLKLFARDIESSLLENMTVVPNYPPRHWMDGRAVGIKKRGAFFSFVYVGALDVQNMYVKEFLSFVGRNSERCTFDIYSNNISKEVLNFIHSEKIKNVYYKGAIEYHNLPLVLPLYNVGLILYKGHIPNFIYNVPNKFFEYAICGLNVWYPREMESMNEFRLRHHISYMTPLDFSLLEDSLFFNATNNENHYIGDWTAESANHYLIQKLIV